MKRRCSLWVSAGLLLWSGAAAAQDVSAAKALFEKGVADLQAGKLDAACPAISESYRLDPRPGTLFTMAECFARAGKTASAVARYEDYLNMFARMTPAEQAKQRGRDQAAHEQHDKLKPHVPTLTLRLQDGAPPGTTVIRAGAALGNAALGLALPIDAGTHTLVTQAPGGPPTSETVTVADDDKKELTLRVKAGDPAPGPAPAPPGALVPPGSAPVALPPPDTREPRGAGQRTAGFIVGGVGVAGLIAGAVTGGLTLSKKSVITANCDLTTKVCKNSTGEDAVGAARTTGLGSTIGFIAGGVALATGAVLVITAPRASVFAPRVSASAGPSGASIDFHLAF